MKLFPLPQEFAYANLNTGTFDKKGSFWFTGQSGVHGRVDPATGKVDAWRSPRPGSYGITTTPGGDVWFASLAGDYIGKVDTAPAPSRGRSAAQGLRAAPHLVGLQGHAVGELLECRRHRPL